MCVFLLMILLKKTNIRYTDIYYIRKLIDNTPNAH